MRNYPQDVCSNLIETYPISSRVAQLVEGKPGVLRAWEESQAEDGASGEGDRAEMKKQTLDAICVKPWVQLLVSLSTFVLLSYTHWLIALAFCTPFELDFCQL